ncbi:uncharacterized protein LOC134838971 isoform X2 [Symsagittifera roscoffensis]|uniref:uncharacterized protein LOC134838971 isoform X2 n=1 Tax=Symsagittifera roscoffensis TaxID=84072 RepID=UPI00307BC61E
MIFLVFEFLLISSVCWAGGPQVPTCDDVTDTCSTDNDCHPSVYPHVTCASVGPPDDPGPKNCICGEGWYGNPKEQCLENRARAPIFGMTMGCFPVDKTDRVIKRAAGDYRDFSLNTYGCRETCSNQETNFAVLQEGDICMCAFDISALTGLQATDDKCNSNCTEEDPDDNKCGGFHEAEGGDGVVTESYSSIFTTQKGVPSVWFVDLNKKLMTMEPSSARLDYSPPPNFCKAFMYYQFDFGTGAGFTYPNSNSWMTWTYTVPGSYILTGKLDGRFPPLDATKVSVGEGVAKEGVVVGCGEYYKYGVKSNCSVSSIVGTGLKVDIYWGDRDRRQFDYSRIEDPYHCLAGNPVMQTINCVDYASFGLSYRPESSYFYSTGGGKVLIDPKAQFSCEGVLKGFEYFVKAASAGDVIKFRLYEPSCAGGTVYCYETMECLAEGDPCLPPFSSDCGDAFCQLGGGCTDGMCRSANRSEAFNGVGYTMVPDAEWTVTLDADCASGCGCHGIYKLDLGTFEAPDHFRVYPGYILALDPGTAKVYYTVDSTSTDVVYEFTSGPGPFQGDPAGTDVASYPGTSDTGYGIKWAFQGHLAQVSTINLTNLLPAPYYDLSYDVEIWVTADKFNDDPDLLVDDVIDGVQKTDVPVYYYQFRVFVHEGIKDILVTPLYPFHPFAQTLSSYKIKVDVDNPAAFYFGLKISISWGDDRDTLTNEDFIKATEFDHVYLATTPFEVCIQVENEVSNAEVCWNVKPKHPVLDKYEVEFSDAAIGCLCGATPLLGNQDGVLDVSLIIPTAEAAHFVDFFPTNATAYFDWDPDVEDLQSVDLVSGAHTPSNPIVFNVVYTSSGCRNVTLTVSNVISMIRFKQRVCVYERITGVQIEEFVSMLEGQVMEEDPVTFPSDSTVCDYPTTDTNCKIYLNRYHYHRITMNQTSTMVNQTFEWQWNDESDMPEEVKINSPVALHKFYYSTYGLQNYVELGSLAVRLSHPLQNDDSGPNAAVLHPIVSSDGYVYRIALAPSVPQVRAVSSVWKLEDTVEATLVLEDVGWKTCCFTFCEGCTQPLAFLQSFYDSEDLNTGAPDPDGNLRNGYDRCNSQSNSSNAWANENAYMYMMNNQREDSEDGVDWEGWQGEGDTAQTNLPNRVIRENVIQVKKHFGADQKSYLLNYFCWNPVGEVHTVYEFSRMDPITCGFPIVSIDYRGSEVFAPHRIYNKDKNFLTGNVIINCDDTLKNRKWWTCQQYSERTGKSIGASFTPPFPGNDTAELVLPAKGLEYGVFKCTLSVQMLVNYESPVYLNYAFTYIKLVSYKLLGQMYHSVTSLDLGMDQEVLLNPGKYSKDMDVDGGSFVDFEWYGKCGDEEYPLNNLGELNRNYPPPLPLGQQPGLAGGLEGQGPGRIANTRGDLLLVTRAFDGMRADVACELMAIFKKSPDPFYRTGQAIISINVFEVSVPTFQVITGNGTTAEPVITADKRPAQKINPIGFFRALADCTGATDCSKTMFQWNLRCLKPGLADPVNFKDILNFDNITMTNDPLLQPAEKLRVTTNLQRIGIPMALLSSQIEAGVVDCYLALKMCSPRTELQIEMGLPPACGNAGMSIVLNIPPKGGNMTVEHFPLMSFGNCLENYLFWKFSFNGWVDPDDGCIKSYKIIQVSGANMLDVPVNQEIRSLEAFKVQQTALYSGPQNPYNEKIKYGDKGKDWAVVLCVRVSDCFGAFVFYCVKDRFMKVKMSEMVTCQDVNTTTLYPPTENVTLTYPSEFKVKQLLTDDPYALETETRSVQLMIETAVQQNMSKYVAEQSNRNITAFALAMVTMLNELMTELDEELTSIEDEMKHLGSEVGRVVGGEEEEEELALILQTKATLRAQAQKTNEEIKQQILVNVDGGLMGLNSPEVIDSVSSALKDSTQKTGELTEASMNSVKSLSSGIGSNLLEQASTLDQGSLESITESSVAAISSIFMGIRERVGEDRLAAENDTTTDVTNGPMEEFNGEAVTGTPAPLAGKMEEWGLELLGMIDTIAKSCQMNKQADEPSTTLATDSMGVDLLKQQKDAITGGDDGMTFSVKALSMAHAPKIALPNFDYLLDDASSWSPSTAISMQNLATPSPGLFGVPGDYLVQGSAMVRIVFSNDQEDGPLSVPEARKAIDMHIPKEDTGNFDVNYEVVKGSMELGKEHQFILRSIELGGDVAISIRVKYVAQLVDEWLCVYVRRGKEPYHDPTLNTWEYDFFERLPRDLTRSEQRRHEGVEYPDQYTYMIENHLLEDSGTYHIGVRPCRKNFDYFYFDQETISNKVFSSDFEFNVWSQGCYFMEDDASKSSPKDYSTRGCVVGSMSNKYGTECMCMHLTAFAGSTLAPAPPALDFSAMSFKFEDMYPVYCVLLLLWMVYILLMLWSRRKDRQDIAKLGFTPLPDNDPADFYMYELAIQTGMLKGAGTTSRIYFYVVGELGRSRIHVVEDPYREILKRNNKDLFLLSTPRSLGRLSSVRLWHDNSGVGSDQSWFCDYIALRDTQTGEKTFFMAYRWWSLVHEDGSIDRTIERTEPENMKKFRYMFASKTREKLNDGHLYYSIFARPVESHFTRCQRCSCAMCVLLLEFCVSAVYYQTKQSVDDSSTVWVGPIKFNIAELGVSFMSSLMVLPASLLVVQLFRRTKPFTSGNEEELDDLDAEEEMLNSSRRKRREEERRKREEKKKEDLTKYLKAAGLTVETKERKNSSDSRSGLTQNMETSTSWDGQRVSSGHSEHSGSTGTKSSLKQPGTSSRVGSSKSVHIRDGSEVPKDTSNEDAGRSRSRLVVSVNRDNNDDTVDPCDLGELSISESSEESEYETDEEELDLDCYERVRRSKWFCCIQCLFGWGEKGRKRHPMMLPASFIYIDWLFVCIILLTTSVVITLYAAMIAFNGGSALVTKWLVSMIGSMTMSIFLMQPLKILILAMIISLLCQRRGRRNEDQLELMDENFEGLTEDELKLLDKLETDYGKDKHLYSGEEVGDIIVGKLPDEEFLDEGWAKRNRVKTTLLPGQLTRKRKSFLREVRQKEIAMFGVAREISMYLVFVWLLFSVCYVEKDATGFYLYDQIKSEMFTGSLNKVYDIDTYWDYLIDHFAPKMYSNEWYNGDRPLGLYQYFADKINLVIGYSVVRQIRIRKHLCMPYKIGRHNISRECNPPFAAEFEDRGRYGPGWVRFDANNPYHILREEYRYIDAEEIDGHPFWGQSATYPGGGFLVRLDGNKQDSLNKLNNLKNEKFIDFYTRAILHEFSIYSPTYNLFAVVTMVSEFRASAGVFSYYYCDPLRLIQYHGPTAPYQIAVQVGLGIFLVAFIFRDGRKIYKQRKAFFKKSWNVIDFTVDILGVLAIVLFIYRYTETESAMSRVSLVGGRKFVNLNYIVTLSLVYLIILASICFVSTIRFLKILNFNKKISMFRDVLVSCRTDLISFAVMFVFLQAGFVTMAYMFFGSFLVRYATPFQTQQSLFNMLLGKFSFEELIQIDETLGAIFFMSYSNCMMLITMNIFVVILDASVGDVNEGLAEKSNEYEILSFLGGRMKYWAEKQAGSAKKTVVDMKHRKEIDERRTLDNKIENLPHKFNHLVDLINDRYFDGQEVFHIQVSDYKDIRMLEKARKKAPREIKKSEMGGDGDNEPEADDEESTDNEIYERMTNDFNTLIPAPKSASVPSKKPKF